MSDFDSSLPIRTQNPGDAIVKVADATTPSQQLAVAADGSINATVSATNLDIRDLSQSQDSVKIGDGTDFLAINTNGSINVVVTDSSGDEINDYNISASLAVNATSNHDYTVTGGKTLHLTQIEASASGKLKIEVQIETAAGSGIFNSKFVQFNSTATPNCSIQLSQFISVVAGARVRIIRTNKDNQAQDVYSTISGNEI